ncbi:putative uncharacterized protein [Pseudomonas sp. Os17]|nr:hypothetical protein CW358_10550 [Pseudomonas protegens]BAQ77883.1 putative uncharacterized protein [Pseudomonas sp. Os17]BAQ84100.1 putative uncharacterized protein [Pseudomonas sp. St29]
MRFFSYLAVLGLSLVCQGTWAQLSSNQAPAPEQVATSVTAETEVAPLDDGRVAGPSASADRAVDAPVSEATPSGTRQYWALLVVVLLGLSWWVQGRLVKRPE